MNAAPTPIPAADSPVADAGLPIAAVEREIGLTKDTLRVWERRYGFPTPIRDAAGDRVYSLDQVQQLKLIRRLLDAGMRPRKVVGLDIGALQAILSQTAAVEPSILSRTTRPPEVPRPRLDAYLAAIAAHSPGELQRELTLARSRLGLERFVTEIVAPLTTAVGEAWAQGRFEIYEEHLYTEVISGVMRHAIGSLATLADARRPKVLLTTLPQEPHGLGLLMVEALLALEGCACVSLGTQTPITDVVRAADAHDVDVVALSFTNLHAAAYVRTSLTELRGLLPDQTALWAGGACLALHQRALPGIRNVRDLSDLQPLLTQWTQAHSERGHF